jgi:hypothetical protein
MGRTHLHVRGDAELDGLAQPARARVDRVGERRLSPERKRRVPEHHDLPGGSRVCRDPHRPSPQPIARAPSRGNAAVPLSPPRDVQVAAPPCSIRSASIRAVRARRRGPNGRGVTLRRSCCRPSLATPPPRPPTAPAHSPPDVRQRWYGISRHTASAPAAWQHAMHDMHARPL